MLLSMLVQLVCLAGLTVARLRSGFIVGTYFLKDLSTLVVCYVAILSRYVCISKDVAHSSRHHGVISEKM